MGKHEMTSSNMNCNCTMKEMTKAKMMLTKNFDNKAPDLIDDGGDDSFLDFVNFDDSDYEYENEEELAAQDIKNAK